MRAEKQLLLNEIKEKIDASTALVVTRYEKLPPNGAWELRDRLAKKGGVFEVVRKRVFLKAAQQAGIALDEKWLAGHVGVLFVSQSDAMEPTKELMKFSEENSQTLELLCGQIEGKIVPGGEVKALAMLPGINEMRAQFLALLVSPMAQTLSVVEAALAGPLSVVEQKSQTE
jgi:large subunit ribosomal protein L10